MSKSPDELQTTTKHLVAQLMEKKCIINKRGDTRNRKSRRKTNYGVIKFEKRSRGSYYLGRFKVLRLRFESWKKKTKKHWNDNNTDGDLIMLSIRDRSYYAIYLLRKVIEKKQPSAYLQSMKMSATLTESLKHSMYTFKR